MLPVQQFIPTALAVMLRKAPLCEEKVAFAWRAAVGESMDHVTRVELRGTVLRVHAKNAAWRREVERSAGLIRSRLAQLLGDDVVRELDVRVPRGSADEKTP